MAWVMGLAPVVAGTRVARLAGRTRVRAAADVAGIADVGTGRLSVRGREAEANRYADRYDGRRDPGHCGDLPPRSVPAPGPAHRCCPAVLARGDDPPEPPAVLARGDDPPEPPAVLAREDNPPEPPEGSDTPPSTLAVLARGEGGPHGRIGGPATRWTAVTKTASSRVP